MALKKCKECGTEVSTTAKSCPKCGATLIKKRGCLYYVIVAIVCIVMIRVFSTYYNAIIKPSLPESLKASESSSPTAPTRPKLEVINYDWTTGNFGVRSIVGTVKNNTSKQYSYIQVVFNLYDSTGVQVGNAMANINNLEPNGTWRFEAAVMEDSASTAKLKEVTGF